LGKIAASQVYTIVLTTMQDRGVVIEGSGIDLLGDKINLEEKRLLFVASNLYKLNCVVVRFCTIFMLHLYI
jgi:hypothetical protein